MWPVDKVNNMVAVSAERREMRRQHRLVRGGGEDLDVVTGSRVVRDDVMRKDRRAARQGAVWMDIWSDKTADGSQI